MPSVSELLVRIDATTEGLRRELKRAESDLGSFAQRSDTSLKKVDGQFQTMGAKVQSFSRMMGSLGMGFGALEAGKFIVAQTDAYVKLENKLQTVTVSHQNLKNVMADLFSSAQKYSIDITSQVDLFRKLSDALKVTGIEQGAVVQLADTFAAGMKASGTSAADASRGIQQLAQAFQNGKLQGDEMITLRETMPKFIEAITAELARVNNISFEEANARLNEFKEKGKINLDIMVAAAQNMREKVVGEATGMATTVEDSMTKMRNSMVMAGEAFGPIIPHITRFFDDLSKGAKVSAEQIESFMATVQRAINIVKELLGITDFSKGSLKTAAENMGVDMKAIEGQTREFLGIVESAKTAVSGMFSTAPTAPAAPARSAPRATAPKAAPAPAFQPEVMSSEFNRFTKFLGYAEGGILRGRGGARDDQNIAWFSPGEFVVNARSAAKHRKLLEAINDDELDDAPRFAAGGVVAAGPSMATATQVNIAGAKINQSMTSFFDRWRVAAETVDRRAAETAAKQTAADAALKPTSTQTAAAVQQKVAARAIPVSDPRSLQGVTAPGRKPAQTDSVEAYSKAVKQSAEDTAIFGAVMTDVEADLRDAQTVFENTRTATELYREEMNRLNELKGMGLLDDETFGRAAQNALEKLTYATEELGHSYTNLDAMADDLGWAMATSFEKAILEGGKLKDLLKSLWKDIQQIVVRQMVTVPLAAGISAAIGGVTGALVPSGGVMAGRAKGGLITGHGSGTSDSIPTMLSTGEFVINSAQTRKHRQLLEAINDNRLSGAMPKFAAGGFVGNAALSGTTGAISITLENKSSQPLKMEGSKSEGPGPDGRTMIRVMVVDAVKGALASGEFDRTMGARYGTGVQPIAR